MTPGSVLRGGRPSQASDGLLRDSRRLAIGHPSDALILAPAGRSAAQKQPMEAFIVFADRGTI